MLPIMASEKGKSPFYAGGGGGGPGVRPRVRISRRARLAVLLAAVLVYVVLFQWRLVPRPWYFGATQARHTEDVQCPRSTAGGSVQDDILVVLRTGASEALEKLPIHFNTTLRCVPHYVVYSDYAETIADHEVHDVFRDVNRTLVATEPAFAPYRHLQRHGREGLVSKPHFGSGPTGSPDNPNWVLDKFKFLPMVKRALQHRGNATWFVFIEADTYLSWPNLLEYLAEFDAKDALYLGNPTIIKDVSFGHGGSGFVLSNAAAQKVTEDRDAHLYAYDQLTVRQWAGDAVLGEKLKDVGVPLTWGRPHLEKSTPSTIDFNATGVQLKPWCYAPVTYHHMRVHEIRQLFDFEQRWRRGANRTTLLYSDVFKGFIQPKLAAAVADEDWDNFSKGLEPIHGPIPTESPEECRAICEAMVTTCLQYSYSAGSCSVTSQVRHGSRPKAGSETIRSGWMTDRIARYVAEMDNSCRSVVDSPWHV